MRMKCWKKRMSSMLNVTGVTPRGPLSAATVNLFAGGYSQLIPNRLQLKHSGMFSGHLILRRLQLKQPFRDLV